MDWKSPSGGTRRARESIEGETSDKSSSDQSIENKHDNHVQTSVPKIFPDPGFDCPLSHQGRLSAVWLMIALPNSP